MTYSDHICVHCSTPFKQHISTGRPYTHCTPECARKHKTIRDRKFYKVRSGAYALICAACKRAWMWTQPSTGGRRPVVCGEACRALHLKAYRAARWRAKVAARVGQRTEEQCKA